MTVILQEITNIEQSGDEEEFVKVAKPLERKVKKPAIDPDNRGYQSVSSESLP